MTMFAIFQPGPQAAKGNVWEDPAGPCDGTAQRGRLAIRHTDRRHQLLSRLGVTDEICLAQRNGFTEQHYGLGLS